MADDDNEPAGALWWGPTKGEEREREQHEREERENERLNRFYETERLQLERYEEQNRSYGSGETSGPVYGGSYTGASRASNSGCALGPLLFCGAVIWGGYALFSGAPERVSVPPPPSQAASPPTPPHGTATPFQGNSKRKKPTAKAPGGMSLRQNPAQRRPAASSPSAETKAGLPAPERLPAPPPVARPEVVHPEPPSAPGQIDEPAAEAPGSAPAPLNWNGRTSGGDNDHWKRNDRDEF